MYTVHIVTDTKEFRVEVEADSDADALTSVKRRLQADTEIACKPVGTGHEALYWIPYRSVRYVGVELDSGVA